MGRRKTQPISEGEEWYAVSKSGEVLGEYKAGDKIIRCPVLDGYIHNWKKGEPFVKLYRSAQKKIRKELSTTESSVCYGLAEFISYKDNILRIDGRRMTIKDLASVFGFKYETMRRIIKSLQKHGVVCSAKVGNIENPEIETKCIIGNPYIYTNGTVLAENIYELFENSGWEKI